MFKNVNMQRPFIIHQRPMKYTAKFKIRVLQEAQKSTTKKQIIDKHKLDERVFYEWQSKGVNYYVE